MASLSPLSDDVLLLERLDVLIETTFDMIKNFATKEQRPLEEIRRYVAQRHYSYLFASADPNDKRNMVQNILKSTSQTLETLFSVASIPSFFLAIDPNDINDEGFLGGTVTGREFWRGLRGGGSAGAKSFKTHCLRSLPAASPTSSEISLPVPARMPAGAIKAEVYSNARNSLRSASGIRNAEMKWKNQDQLEMYGVRLVGWPPDVPRTNPSTLSVEQNKLVLEALKNNTLKFLSISSAEETPASSTQKAVDEMDIYLRYEDQPSTSVSSSVRQYSGSSPNVAAQAVQEPPLPVTGPSPFSVSSGRTTYSTSQVEGNHKKRRREDDK